MSVDRVADHMGLNSKWLIYRYMENGRMPVILVRPFESACGATYVTEYIAHSAHKLVTDIPAGRAPQETDIHRLQERCTEAVGLLFRVYAGEVDPREAADALIALMEVAAFHRHNVERVVAPQLEFDNE